MTLEPEEINNLLAALVCWENEPSNKELQGSMFGMMFAGLGEADEDKRKERISDARRKSDLALANAKKEGQMRREQSIILQAKLITHRNETYKNQLT